jgi:proliferating cell nuclear antigen
MIVLKNTEFFKKAIEAISSFVPEGNIRFSDKGIFFKAVDPSQVVLIDYFIDKKLFDDYLIEPNFVGVDMVEFNKILQRALPKDKLSIDVSDAELKIKMESDLKRSFRLPLIDIGGEEAKTPQIKYSSKIIIGSVSLKEMLRDAKLFGSSVIIKITSGKFFVEARGSQGTMDSEATSVSKIESLENIHSKFSLSFFQTIINEADQSEKITLELKNDSPMRISYNIGQSNITFYLAHMLL